MEEDSNEVDQTVRNEKSIKNIRYLNMNQILRNHGKSSLNRDLEEPELIYKNKPKTSQQIWSIPRSKSITSGCDTRKSLGLSHQPVGVDKLPSSQRSSTSLSRVRAMSYMLNPHGQTPFTTKKKNFHRRKPSIKLIERPRSGFSTVGLTKSTLGLNDVTNTYNNHRNEASIEGYSTRMELRSSGAHPQPYQYDPYCGSQGTYKPQISSGIYINAPISSNATS